MVYKPLQLIEAGVHVNAPILRRDDGHKEFLSISEMFVSIQGEGVHTGCPSLFIRLVGCSLNCDWCDTKDVWRNGKVYTFEDIFCMLDNYKIINKLKNKMHLVLTGGSPLIHQKRIVKFLDQFMYKYNFLPFVEVENECSILPTFPFIRYVNCWNNSPKLKNSGVPDELRFRPNIIEYMSKKVYNSWFKFVVSTDEDWQEIEVDFLKRDLIRKEQIILMPLAATREELAKNREKVIEIAIRENVRYCTREQVVIWNKTTGV